MMFFRRREVRSPNHSLTRINAAVNSKDVVVVVAVDAEAAQMKVALKEKRVALKEKIWALVKIISTALIERRRRREIRQRRRISE
jgi:hypothetical protein